MGLMSKKQVPVGLTFSGRAYDDNKLLSYGCALEQGHTKRAAPALTPMLPTDNVPQGFNHTLAGTKPSCLENVTLTKFCGDVVTIL
jgi:amidase